jgi:arsenite-transporting ATPase
MPRRPPRYRFFAGKGGVGKTTLSAARAVALAAAGARTLILSTDPAHSLGDVLGVALSERPRRIKAAPGTLLAAEVDADAALARWLRERRGVLHTLAARGTYLDDDDIDRLLELSLPGVDELVGLLEVKRLAEEADVDEVVVDTAPTGHTLRLLAMPATLRDLAQLFDGMQAKHRFLGRSLGGRHRADAADAVIAEIDEQGRALEELLRDGARVRFCWVALPEELPLRQAEQGLAELAGRGMHVEALLVNRVTPPGPPCALCGERRREEAQQLRALGLRFPATRLLTVPAKDAVPRGPHDLLHLARRIGGVGRVGKQATTSRPARHQGGERALAQLSPAGIRLLLFGGKGGVGKTSCAAATALHLAKRSPEARILLLSTDPAHALGNALGVQLGDVARTVPGAPANLLARELDAPTMLAQHRERYRAAIDDLFDALRGGSAMDPSFDRQVVQDLIELSPPGLDELFGILGVIDALFPAAGAQGFDQVVVDTAPTGHTLRLLALPPAAIGWVQALLAILLKYRHLVTLGQLAQDLVQLSRELKQLQALLADPSQTRFIAVTRPEPMPVLETRRLLAALARLHIPVGPLLVNAVTPDGCAGCGATRAREQRLLRPGSFGPASPAMIEAPALAPPPHGPQALGQFAARWSCRP